MASRRYPQPGSSAARRDRPSGTDADGGAAHGLGWIPIALGGAAVVAGLGGRKKAALALGALAGAGALSALNRAQSGPAQAGGTPEVERSITIGKSADELRESWRDPRTLPQIMAGFAIVRPGPEGRLHWKLEGPLGRACEWETESVEHAGGAVGWRALSGAAVATEATVRFAPAPAGRGTVVTLHWRFDPPGGALGEWVLELLGGAPLRVAADGVLRRFKNLVETGEIPTTARQPAARADTH